MARRSITGSDVATPSATTGPDGPAVTTATCGQPPARRVQASSLASVPPAIVVRVGAAQVTRWSSQDRHRPEVAMASRSALLALPDISITRAAGWVQPPQNTSRVRSTGRSAGEARPGCTWQASLRASLPAGSPADAVAERVT